MSYAAFPDRSFPGVGAPAVVAGDSVRSDAVAAFAAAVDALGYTTAEWEGEEQLFNPDGADEDVRVRYLGCQTSRDEEMGGTSFERVFTVALYVTAANGADARDALEAIENGVTDTVLDAGGERVHADCQGEQEVRAWQGKVLFQQNWTLTHLKG